MGAVQQLPPNLMDKALDDMHYFIVNIADDLSRMVRQKLIGLLGYFRTYWVNKLDRNSFTLFDLPCYRTNNHAESYHGRLGRKFGRKRSPLCEWLSFHQLIQSEEEEEAVANNLFGIEDLQLNEQQNEENSASMRAKVVNLAIFMEEYALGEKNDNDLRTYLTKYLDEMGRPIFVYFSIIWSPGPYAY
uniref:Transposase n=1 Tax=Acrobeloides nanus TaxID=290746 RepID=A0A914DFA8_9BILA